MAGRGWLSAAEGRLGVLPALWEGPCSLVGPLWRVPEVQRLGVHGEVSSFMFLVLCACNFVKVSPPASVTAVVLRTLRLGKRNYGGSHGQEVAAPGLQPKLCTPAASVPSASAGLAALARGGAAEASGPGLPGGGGAVSSPRLSQGPWTRQL